MRIAAWRMARAQATISPSVSPRIRMAVSAAPTWAGAAASNARRMPASFGVLGPGDSSTPCGFSPSASATLIASLRTTCVFAPAWFSHFAEPDTRSSIQFLVARASSANQ